MFCKERPKSISLKIFYPNYFTNRAISYACISLAEAMNTQVFNVTVMGLSSIKSIDSSLYANAIPHQLKRIAFHLFGNKLMKRFAEYRFRKTLKPGDVAYLWPGGSLSLYKEISKIKDVIIVCEKVNTHDAYGKKLLDSELSRLGMSCAQSISDEKVKYECENNRYVSYFFSPSEIVSQSLRDNDISDDSIIDASYGVRKSEIVPDACSCNYGSDAEITAIFVGRIGIRKGVHLLLSAWQKADIKGRLLLVGAIEENIKELVNRHLSDNIQHIPYTKDLSDIYCNADVFLLPSIEEGSPLVTYLALGAGLPSIVSPMGGGGIISSNEGYVIDPHDEDAWVDAIRRLAGNGDMRKSMGKYAKAKASEYTWDVVGERRAKSLAAKLQNSHWITES